MEELRFLAFVCAIPICYPCAKFISRKPFNVFDLLIVFYTVYFCFIPFLSDRSYFDPKIFISNYLDYGYLYYLITILVILLVDFLYTMNSGYKCNLFNITNYIYFNVRKLNSKNIEMAKKKMDYVFLFYVFLFCFVFFRNYMENTLVVNMSYEDIRYYYAQKSYFERSMSMLYNSIFPIINSFFIVYYIVCYYYRIKLSFLSKLLLVIISLVLFLGSRSYIFFLLVVAFVVYYSINSKKAFNTDILKFLFIAYIVIGFIFPLIVSVRVIQRMTSSDLMTLDVGIFFNEFVSNIINNNTIVDFSTESNKARSLSVFSSYMMSFTTPYQTGMGELSLNAFIHALPKILFPFKTSFEDAQILIENRLGVFTDMGDSIPLFFKMDFGFWGALLIAPIYYLIIFLWDKIRSYFEYMSIDNLFLKYFYLYIVLYMCVNVEVFIGTYISSIFIFLLIDL